MVGRVLSRITLSQKMGAYIQYSISCGSKLYWFEKNDLKGDIFKEARNLTTEAFEIKKILNNLDSDRLQINKHNFINTIERLKPFFDNPIDAIHCFYTIVAYWDVTSTATEK